MGTMDFAMIEILFIYELARKPVQAVALVVPRPVPRDARQVSLPGMPQFVNPAPFVQMVTRSMKRRNQTALRRLGHAQPRLEISK